MQQTAPLTQNLSLHGRCDWVNQDELAALLRKLGTVIPTLGSSQVMDGISQPTQFLPGSVPI
jgi:hypothetical protein